jgi:glycosyltransferase involved in cell wall biosynthesis
VRAGGERSTGGAQLSGNVEARRDASPALSVVVVVFNMAREAPRMLHSLSAAYQQGVGADEYEVVVVDNGSRPPLGEEAVRRFGPNFRYRYVEDASPSPSRAINLGIAMARSDYLAIMIDGARILSPGVLRHGLELPRLFARPCGLVHGWHIGPDFQSRSIERGYGRDVEDALLASIGWPADGYRLFEISSPHDPIATWFELVDESNCTFAHRDVLAEVGGYDERYQCAAGGLVNLDVQVQLLDHPRVDTVIVLGEGTFHQFHGGHTSSTPQSRLEPLVEGFKREYLAIRGEEWVWPRPFRAPHFLGHLPAAAERFLSPFAVNVYPELVAAHERIRRLHAVHSSLEVEVRRLHGEAQARDSVLEEMYRRVAACDRQIADGHREAACLDAAIAAAQDEVARLDALLAPAERR